MLCEVDVSQMQSAETAGGCESECVAANGTDL